MDSLSLNDTPLSRRRDRSVRDMLMNRAPGYGLPGAFYTDPDIYALDLSAIFEREWIFVCATCEVPKPGSFVTVTIGRSPIIVLRDREGAIRAFFNTCRHRGSRLCDAERGHAPALICPYHRWTYRLDGTLAHAKHMPADFDVSAFPLLPVHVRTVGGTVYVSLADEPPDFAPYAAALSGPLAPHRLETAKLAFEADLIERPAMANSCGPFSTFTISPIRLRRRRSRPIGANGRMQATTRTSPRVRITGPRGCR